MATIIAQQGSYQPAPDRQPLVSFVTVNTNQKDFIRHLLQGLQEAALSFPFEYFIVDNGSTDGSIEMVKQQFPWATQLENGKNIGFGPANNRAMRVAKGKYIAIMNPDLVIFPGECEKWLAWMEQHSEVGMSGPHLLNPDGSDQDSLCRFHELLTPVYRRTWLGKTPWGKRALERYLAKDIDRTKEQDVDWILGAAMIARKDVLSRIDYFDERFFLYFEDEDLCRRIWEAGLRVTYTPAAKFVHYYQRASRTRHFWEALTNPKTRLHIKSGIQYFSKYARKSNPRLLLQGQSK